MSVVQLPENRGAVPGPPDDVAVCAHTMYCPLAAKGFTERPLLPAQWISDEAYRWTTGGLLGRSDSGPCLSKIRVKNDRLWDGLVAVTEERPAGAQFSSCFKAYP